METPRAANADALYAETVAAFGPAIERLARAYEHDADRRRDLVQEIHVALWRSLATFESRCSLRTWVYRVAHNAAASHALRERRERVAAGVSLDEIEALPGEGLDERTADRALARQRLATEIERLPPIDRQVIVLYLEGLEAAEIAEVTGLRAGNVATKVHRLKNRLARGLQEGGIRD